MLASVARTGYIRSGGCSMQFEIPEQNLEKLRSEIAKLSKRAKKLGSGEITLTELGEMWQRKRAEGPAAAPFRPWRIIRWMVVEVEGETPKLAGWSFRAKVLNGAFVGDAVGGVIQPLGEIAIPEATRDQALATPHLCEHCKADRRRRDTFLVEHDDGRWAQVGRQCMKDFLGHANPEAMAKAAEYVLTAVGLAGEAEEEGWGGGRREELFPLEDFFAVVMGLIRTFGYLSKTAANPPFTPESTAEMAMMVLVSHNWRDGKPICELGSEDSERAAKLMAWATEWLATPSNDYQFNAANAFASGVASTRTAGILASLAPAWDREMAHYVAKQKAAEKATESRHVGTVKKRDEMTLTLIRSFSFDTDFGLMYIHKMQDPEGNSIVWKTGNAVRDSNRRLLEAGQTVRVKATVKEHGEYKGEKQTVVTRVTPLGEIMESENAA